MKYWSSSRVGTVPQGGQPKLKKRSEKYSNRKKGITMEDLKQQTANRLAHEQHQKGGRPAAVNDGESGFAKSAQHPDAAAAASGSEHSYGGLEDSSSSHDDPAAAAAALPQQPQVISRQDTNEDPNLVRGAGQQPPYRQDASASDIKQLRSPPPAVSTMSPYSASIAYLPEPRREYSMDRQRAMDPHTNPSSSFDSSAAGNAKLPHGLTVYELKEMTKARLQATRGPDNNNNAAMPTTTTLTGGAQLQLGYQQGPQHAAVSVSPVPPSFSRHPSHPSLSGQQYRGGEQDSSTRGGGEAWETASAASTVASDYLGSESAFPASSGGGGVVNNGGGITSLHSADEYNSSAAAASSPFGRARTYPETMPPPASPGRGTIMSPGAYFESPSTSSYGPNSQNRRRAATLSPRPHSLIYLHEDRPVHQPDVPDLPSFAPQHHNPYARDSYAPRTHALGEPSELSNRARASTAPSRPPEFSPHTYGQVPRSDHAAPATGLYDVFRDPASTSPAPPGFLGGSDPSHVDGQQHDVVAGSRIRAATWGAPSTSMFGPRLIGNGGGGSNHGSTDSLADDLGDILKLSVGDHHPSTTSNNNTDRSLFRPPPGMG